MNTDFNSKEYKYFLNKLEQDSKIIDFKYIIYLIISISLIIISVLTLTL